MPASGAHSPTEIRLPPSLCVYQDVVVDGRTVLRGQRDCEGRWALLEPHLPASGTVLDVGSNFGWFGLQLCQTRPECVVVSVEADERSAAVQRQVLASHHHARIALITRRAGTRLARQWARAGQRFDAALLLAVLHWIPDHRAFLANLGPLTGRLLIEQPDARESGAGSERIRREIGPLGPYLGELFPTRPVVCLGELPSHRQTPYPRTLWLVGEPEGWQPTDPPELDATTLLDLGLSWPPRRWWAGQLAALGPGASGRAVLTPRGLQLAADGRSVDTLAALGRRARRLPEGHLFTAGQWWYRRTRQWAGGVLRRLGLAPRGGGG